MKNVAEVGSLHLYTVKESVRGHKSDVVTERNHQFPLPEPSVANGATERGLTETVVRLSTSIRNLRCIVCSFVVMMHHSILSVKPCFANLFHFAQTFSVRCVQVWLSLCRF